MKYWKIIKVCKKGKNLTHKSTKAKIKIKVYENKSHISKKRKGSNRKLC